MLPEILQLAKGVKLLTFDVDGVMTDGGLWFDSQGEMIKRFDAQDGLGMKLAMEAGIELAVITGIVSSAVEHRIRRLGITEYHEGKVHKLETFFDMCRRLKVEPYEVAYVGDDWVDAGIMQHVGLPIAVANAQPEILQLAKVVTQRQGGHGAVREVIRMLFEAKGILADVWARWGNT